MIIEAREKSRSGFFEPGLDDDPLSSISLCFGFKVEDDGFVSLVNSNYDRVNGSCDTNTTVVSSPDKPDTIVIKNVGNFEALFVPPYSNVQVVSPGGFVVGTDFSIIVGYEESELIEKPLDHREIIFDTLSGNVYSQKYETSTP